MQRVPATASENHAKLPRLNDSNLAVTCKIGPPGPSKTTEYKQGKAERQSPPSRKACKLRLLLQR